MDSICICIFLFFAVAIVLFLYFSTVIGELKIIITGLRGRQFISFNIGI